MGCIATAVAWGVRSISLVGVGEVGGGVVVLVDNVIISAGVAVPIRMASGRVESGVNWRKKRWSV